MADDLSPPDGTGAESVDAWCRVGDWAGLVARRRAWRDAGDPRAVEASYRLVREAPVQWLAAALGDTTPGDTSPGAPGTGWPLVELAAARFTWADAAPHLPASQRGAFADERVLHGEDLTALGPTEDGLPRRVARWEPPWVTVGDGPGGPRFPRPVAARREVRTARLDRPGEPIGDPYTVEAFEALGRGWAASPGGVRVMVTEGRAIDALTTLCGATGGAVEIARRTPVEALALLGWVGASAGAGPTGRTRPGAAAGRAAVWRVLAALGARTEDWPVPADDLGAVAEGLRWWAWRPAPEHADRSASVEDADTDGAVRLVVEDTDEELSWAVELQSGAS